MTRHKDWDPAGGALTEVQILDADRQEWKKRATDAEALLAKAAKERDHWEREASRFQCDWARAEAKLADRADWSGVIAEKDAAITALRGLVEKAEAGTWRNTVANLGQQAEEHRERAERAERDAGTYRQHAERAQRKLAALAASFKIVREMAEMTDNEGDDK